MDKKPVLVTTKYRGVFFGYVEDDSQVPTKIILSSCRCCVYWDRSQKGVLGLAATGPGEDCRIGPAVPRAKLWDITAVFDVTVDAAEAWEAAPWKQ
jgi:hypothetical protein